MNKSCTKCGVVYPATSEFFATNKNHKDYLQSYCRKCGSKANVVHRQTHPKSSETHRKGSKKYYQKNKEKCRRNRHMYNLKINLGLTPDDYDKMYSQQGGYCAICGVHQLELKMALAVDHDHKTGKIRGLLCANCNRGLGGFRDCKEYLLKAIKYLGE